MAFFQGNGFGSAATGFAAPNPNFTFNGSATTTIDSGTISVSGSWNFNGVAADTTSATNGWGGFTGFNSTAGFNNGWANPPGGTDFSTWNIPATPAVSWPGFEVNLLNSDDSFQFTGTVPGISTFSSTVNFGSAVPTTALTNFQGSAGADGVLGSQLADTVSGNAGNDFILGLGGDDTIDGGIGADVLDGGSGVNTLTGGTGADLFQFTNNSTQNTITDFSAAQGDQIVFISPAGEDFSSLSISDDANGNARVLSGTVDITLQGVSAASLTATDFLFI